jgi:hypothetical protein
MGSTPIPTMLTAAMVVAVATMASAHVPLQPPGAMVVKADMNVGGATYAAKGPGECRYSAGTGLLEGPGQMWSLRRHDAAGDVNFMMWRLRHGGDMFTLTITSGGKTHGVSTLQIGPHSDAHGSGSVTFEQRGSGGQFTIAAVDAGGAKLTGTLWCSVFIGPEDHAD